MVGLTWLLEIKWKQLWWMNVVQHLDIIASSSINSSSYLDAEVSI
jgi:hypothetical protein